MTLCNGVVCSCGRLLLPTGTPDVICQLIKRRSVLCMLCVQRTCCLLQAQQAEYHALHALHAEMRLSSQAVSPPAL